MFKEGFQKIADTINSDFDRGARGTHFVKTDNYDRIEELAEELKRVDIDITYILLNLKRFKAEDVTEKLMGIFREAKREGERLKEKYPKASKDPLSVASSEIYHFLNGKSSECPENIEQTIKYIDEFKDLVRSWAPYDIKRRFSWSQDLQYIFDGKVIDFDDTGNMAYGVLAKASGMFDILMELGAGLINAKEALEGSWYSNKDVFELNKNLLRELSWWKTYGDDPRDNEAIKLGVEYYYKL